MTVEKQPSLLQSLIPIGVLVLLLFVNVFIFKANATNGPNQIAMVLAAGIAMILAYRLGYKWNHIEESIVKSISSAMGAILILMVI